MNLSSAPLRTRRGATRTSARACGAKAHPFLTLFSSLTTFFPLQNGRAPNLATVLKALADTYGRPTFASAATARSQLLSRLEEVRGGGMG